MRLASSVSNTEVKGTVIDLFSTRLRSVGMSTTVTTASKAST